MISFIKAALREIDHVVWPTEAETRKYFTVVTIMIGISTVVLFTFGTLVSKGMFAIRAVTPHDISTLGAENSPTEDILKDLNLKKQTATDAKASASGGSVATPSVTSVPPAVPVTSTGTSAATLPAVSTGASSAAPVVTPVATPVVPKVSTWAVAIPVRTPTASTGVTAIPVPAVKTSIGTASGVPVIPKK